MWPFIMWTLEFGHLEHSHVTLYHVNFGIWSLWPLLCDPLSCKLWNLVTWNTPMWPFIILTLEFGHFGHPHVTLYHVNIGIWSLGPPPCALYHVNIGIWSLWPLPCDPLSCKLWNLVTLATPMWPFIMWTLEFGHLEHSHVTLYHVNFGIWSLWTLPCALYHVNFGIWSLWAPPCDPLSCEHWNLVTWNTPMWPFTMLTLEFGHLGHSLVASALWQLPSDDAMLGALKIPMA